MFVHLVLDYQKDKSHYHHVNTIGAWMSMNVRDGDMDELCAWPYRWAGARGVFWTHRAAH